MPEEFHFNSKDIMILIISHPEDIHAKTVTEALKMMGIRPHLLDLSRFPKHSRISLSYGKQGSAHLEDDREGLLDLSACRAVWWRRPQAFKLDDRVGDPIHRAYALNESREVFGGLWGLLNAKWINDPQRDDQAHRKVYQLREAEKVGLSIPDTMITNNPESAKHFVQKRPLGQSIYKSFSGTPEAWRETRLVGKEEVIKMDLVQIAPLIFQEYIQGFDIRVTVVGDKIFPAQIDNRTGTYPIDFRMNYSTIDIKSIELPKELSKKILLLMKNLGLIYGALDFKLSPSGQFKFLEINPAGQWLFIEYKTKQPISNAIAEKLVQLATH